MTKIFLSEYISTKSINKPFSIYKLDCHTFVVDIYAHPYLNLRFCNIRNIIVSNTLNHLIIGVTSNVEKIYTKSIEEYRICKGYNLCNNTFNRYTSKANIDRNYIIDTYMQCISI